MKLIVIISGMLCLVSCNNSVKSPTPKVDSIINKEVESDYKLATTQELAKINKLVAENEIKSPEEIVKLYRPQAEVSEGNYTYNISHKIDDQLRIQLTLIEDGLLDDSQRSRKSVFTMNMKDKELIVLQLKEQFRCRKNRGSQEWGVTPCL